MALATIVVLFLANFMMRSLEKILGKGLLFTDIFEFVVFNLAWMVAMSAPIAVLLATLMVYGRLSANYEIVGLSSSGISHIKIAFPSIVFGFLMAGALVFFSAEVLPEWNHHARNLGRAIFKKRPDLSVEPGFFLHLEGEGDAKYVVYTAEKEDTLFKNVLIYNLSDSKMHETIFANFGSMKTHGENLVLSLKEGEIHTLDENEEYTQIQFQRHRFTIPLDNLDLEKSGNVHRSDREMNLAMLDAKIGKYFDNIQQSLKRIQKQFPDEKFPENPTQNEILQHIQELRNSFHGETFVFDINDDKAKRQKRRIKSELDIIKSYERQINRYRVEWHKKFSIPFASFIFVLLGFPLGVRIRGGSLSLAVATSLGIFLVYWAFLIAGEELADRMIVTASSAMWTPNAIMGVFALILWIQMARPRLMHFEK